MHNKRCISIGPLFVRSDIQSFNIVFSRMSSPSSVKIKYYSISAKTIFLFSLSSYCAPNVPVRLLAFFE